jgi:hypothetical protein
MPLAHGSLQLPIDHPPASIPYQNNNARGANFRPGSNPAGRTQAWRSAVTSKYRPWQA